MCPRTLILSLALLLAAGAFSVQAKPPTSRPVDPFSLDRLHEIHLTLTSAAWDQMQPVNAGFLARLFARPASRPATRPVEGQRLPPSPAGNEYAYVKAQLEFDGEKCSDIGLRFSGNSSYRAGGTTLQRPYKLDFNRFRPDATFLGLKALNLHNNAFDPSQMRETLSYLLFRDAGIPACRASCAAVYITVQGRFTRQYAGFYAIVEEVDKTCFKANHLQPGGLLLKPENLGGGVRSLGPVWNSLYVALYRPRTKGEPDPADTRIVVELANLVTSASDAEFRQRLEGLLDVDAFLRFVAMNTLLSNLDSYFITGHNYYLYVNPASHRVVFMPWDLNLSIGSFVWVGQPSEQIRLSILKPYTTPNRLIERVLAVDAWKQQYKTYLRLYADTVFAPDKIQSQTAQLASLVEQSRAKWTQLGQKPHPAPGLGMWRWGPIPEPIEFLPAHMRSVRAQLDGTETGYEPFIQFRTILFGPQTRPAQ